MMRSMFSGVSGLRVHQTRMDVIGNNIANVNTIGYKAQRVTFNEVFSQTLQGASSASDETGRGGLNPMQVGLGVNVSSIDMLMTQGAAQRTDNPFDLMINGEGFITVKDNEGVYFTRAGALRQDDDGNLVIPNGMKVQGWTNVETDANGKQKVVPGEIKDIKLNDPSTKTTAPKTTTKAQLSGNLNSIDTDASTQIKFYDSLGNYYNLNVDFKQTASGEWTGTLASEVTDQKGNKYDISATTVPAPINLVFDKTGKLTAPATKQLQLTGIGLAPQTGGPAIPNSQFEAIDIDISNLTQYSSKTNIDSKAIDGNAPGKMMGYDIGADGTITAHYDNGDRKLLGQVIVAQFDNPPGLEKVGDNLYRATSNSGDFDNIGKVGNFQAGVLEMSNVDLAKEFTEMIVTQRGFQANSRIISVSDEMLTELANLKR